jgi:hypothetical protein
MFSKVSLFFLFGSLFFTRFYGLRWGNGFFFHPDENNMAQAISQLSPSNLNPHFFAYGQFPLYLGYFSLKFTSLPNTFTNAIYVLRFWSAFFSILTCFALYSIFKNKLFFLLLIFSPGLIQMAHFGTTESLLFFIFAANLYLSQKKSVFLTSLISGIGIATKISATFFLLPVIFSLKPKKIFLFLSLTLIFAVIFSPHNLISYQDFISSMTYETGVATGKIAVFYTRQFIDTIPYFFQFTHIFPYTSGLPVFVLAIFGFISFITDHRSQITNHKKIIIVSVLIYFLYFGQLFTKWTRFMSPLFFVFPLLASLLLTQIKNRPIKIILIIFCLLPGLSFFRLYLQNDTRLTASNWFSQNLSPNSAILSEAGNVINLPITYANLSVTNFDFYNLDSDLALQSELSDLVLASDYILIPSRRIFMNQNNDHFPFSQSYYQSLFSKQSWFKLVTIFAPNNNFVLNDELAEETWTVFDRPTIRLYQRL